MVSTEAGPDRYGVDLLAIKSLWRVLVRNGIIMIRTLELFSETILDCAAVNEVSSGC